MKALLDAVLLDIGGTLVQRADPGTPVAELPVVLRPGVVDDLTWMGESVRLGAVTDTAVMTEADVRALLGPSGVSALLETVTTSVDVGAAKPDPTSLRAAMARMGLTDAHRVLYIGDQPEDEAAAAAAGVCFLAVPALTGKQDLTLRAAVQNWLERTAGHRRPARPPVA